MSGSSAQAGAARAAPRGRVALASGNEMIAEGALAAGCSFFSGYPITPASEIYAEMMRRLPARGGTALGAPDEISALSYAVGAALAGARAMTATSGPGWALMVETVQYALMTETPVVVVVSQRLGPATGGATQGAQGDVLWVEHSTSGGYPIPVLCPVDAADAYALTAEAFAWAESLRTPVVLLTDKETGKTVESVDLDALPVVGVVSRRLASPGERFLPYAVASIDDVPAFAPVGGPLKVTTTGSAHDASGRLRKNDPETLRQLGHLAAKVLSRAASLERVRWRRRDGARTLLVSYGVSARACRQVEADLAARGEAVNALEVLSLWPVPAGFLAKAAREVERVVVVEENGPGLYASEVERHAGRVQVCRVTSVGAPVAPERILAEVLA